MSHNDDDTIVSQNYTLLGYHAYILISKRTYEILSNLYLINTWELFSFFGTRLAKQSRNEFVLHGGITSEESKRTGVDFDSVDFGACL